MISDLKDFEKMLKICRKAGVNKISVNGIAVEFGDLPTDGAQPAQPELPGELSFDDLPIEQQMFMAARQQ